MHLVDAALWGLLGGLAVEGLQFIADGRKVGAWPWSAQDGPARSFYLAAIVVRFSVGGILAGALGASGQIDTPIAALIAGISAPLTIERVAAQGVTLATANQGARQAPAEPAIEIPNQSVAGGTDAE
ncbi:hypothetical protein [Actinoplanes sp. HUAS TT8]|uniref:hypothetical protein n=1 Tax=Actinoplanes sp. HUAS TT8 TaxID=3447453 RepID=UPI003F51CFE3